MVHPSEISDQVRYDLTTIFSRDIETLAVIPEVVIVTVILNEIICLKHFI